MDDLRSLAQQAPHAVGSTDKRDEGKEDEQVGIGEEINELTDGVVGRHCREEFRLAGPAEGELIARHLHPDTIDGIRRNRTDVSHYEMIVLSEYERVDQ